MNWSCTVEQCESVCEALWGLLATRGEREAADTFHFLLPPHPQLFLSLSAGSLHSEPEFRGTCEDVPQIPQTSSFALFHQVPHLL